MFRTRELHGPQCGTIDINMANPKQRRAETRGSSVPRTEPAGLQLAAAASTFALLGNPARLHVLWLAARSEQDVTALAEQTGVGVATMSQHLTKLRLAGLINVRREGRRHIYTVDDPHVLTLVEQIFAHIAPDGSLAPDPPA